MPRWRLKGPIEKKPLGKIARWLVKNAGSRHLLLPWRGASSIKETFINDRLPLKNSPYVCSINLEYEIGDPNAFVDYNVGF